MGNRLIQVDADNIVGFEFVRDCAVTCAGNHGCQAFALLHKIFVADWVIEALTDSNIAELDTATWGRSSHASSLEYIFGEKQFSREMPANHYARPHARPLLDAPGATCCNTVKQTA